MEDNNHNSIMLVLGELKHTVQGTNTRLDTLNHSTAKHEQRLNSQDVLNSQITITQGQIVSDMKEMKIQDTTNNAFILRTQGSIDTFKWLVGFIGVGTLITLLKVLGFIGTFVKP